MEALATKKWISYQTCFKIELGVAGLISIPHPPDFESSRVFEYKQMVKLWF